MSFFWSDTTADYKELYLRQIWNSLSTNPSDKINLLFQNYLLALGTENKSTSKYSKDYHFDCPTVINATEEISFNREVRGLIVLFKNKKEPKSRFSINRAYSTFSNNSDSLHSLKNEDFNNLGFERLGRLWIVNYNNPNRIYYNLKGILNINQL